MTDSTVEEVPMYPVEEVEAEAPFNLQDALYKLDDTDCVDLPSGQHAEVKEMTGNEQRNFMNRTKQMNGTAIQELLGACVTSIQDAPLPTNVEARTKFLLDLLSGDRQCLVFHIRRHSLGSEFHFTAKCPEPECGKEATWEVDLSVKEDFPVTPYKLGTIKEVEYESAIKPGLKIKYTLLDGHAEMAVLRKRNQLTVLTDLEQRKPHGWDGKRWVPVLLNRMTDRLITEMRQNIKEFEGSIRTTVDLVCENCASTVSFDLLQQPDFMIPSATS